MEAAVVDQMLAQQGAVLVRNKKHQVWQLPNGKKFVRSNTPSDHRAEANSASVLRKLIGDVPAEVLPAKPAKVQEPIVVAAKPQQPQIKASVRKITPDLATEWLDLRNTHNRNLSINIAEKYARDMAMGRWTLNGEPIILATDGSLMDGQHRLKAVVLSGTAVHMLVVEGIAREHFSTVNTGKARNLSDVLHIDGYRNTAQLSSAIVWLMRLQSDTVTTKRAFTQSECRDALALNPGIVDSVRRIGNTKQVKRLASLAMCAALHHEFAGKDSAMADLFIESLDTGTALERTDPIYLLRERLIANSSSIGKMPSVVVAALIVKAWNATVKGTKLRKFVWNPEREDFPAIASPEPTK
jgi:hypothetical protein